MVSSLIEVPILSIPVRRRTGAAILHPILGPWVAATFAGASGWIVSRHVDHGLAAAALGSMTAALLYTGAVVLLRRADVLRIVRLATRSSATLG
jgi:hypothetical protein